MAKETKQERIDSALFRVIHESQQLYDELKRNKVYSDDYHKKVTSKIATLNNQQNAAGKIVVAEAVFSRVQILLDDQKALPERR
jgi:uncharacterized protein (DUF342 family)